MAREKTLLERIESLLWYDAIQKLRDILKDIFNSSEKNLTAGTNITIDRTDPNNPVINSTGGSGTQDLQSVTDLGDETTNTIKVRNSDFPEVVLEMSDVGFKYSDSSGSTQVTFTIPSGDGFFQIPDLNGENVYAPISVNGVKALTQEGDIILSKEDIGLSNVDNTSDINKPISTAVSTTYSPVQYGTFSGEFPLTSIGNGVFDNLTQAGSLTLSVGVSALVGVSDYVKITANGSAITVPDAWINVGSDSISTTNGAINRIIVTTTTNEIWYTVKVL